MSVALSTFNSESVYNVYVCNTYKLIYSRYFSNTYVDVLLSKNMFESLVLQSCYWRINRRRKMHCITCSFKQVLIKKNPILKTILLSISGRKFYFYSKQKKTKIKTTVCV